MQHRQLTRRGLLAAGGAALGNAVLGGTAHAKDAPASTVAIARCRTYDRPAIEQSLRTMFDQVGGIGSLVKNKTVAIKLNLTGQPQRFPVDPALPYRSEPNTVLAVAQLIEHPRNQCTAGWGINSRAGNGCNIAFSLSRVNAHFLNSARTIVDLCLYLLIFERFAHFIGCDFDLHQ
jgi:hypothetical protein